MIWMSLHFRKSLNSLSQLSWSNIFLFFFLIQYFSFPLFFSFPLLISFIIFHNSMSLVNFSPSSILEVIKANWFWFSSLWALLVVKTHENQPLSLSQPMPLGKCSYLIPCVVGPLSPFSDQGSSLWNTCDPFLPQTTSTHFYLPQCGLLSPSCALCSVRPQISFLGIQNDLIFI